MKVSMFIREIGVEKGDKHLNLSPKQHLGMGQNPGT
jgi:hypothetical protein